MAGEKLCGKGHNYYFEREETSSEEQAVCRSESLRRAPPAPPRSGFVSSNL